MRSVHAPFSLLPAPHRPPFSCRLPFLFSQDLGLLQEGWVPCDVDRLLSAGGGGRGQQAGGRGVGSCPGVGGAEVIEKPAGGVTGVATGNLGIGKDGEPTANFQLGMALHGKYTVFAEGSRGHLGRQLISRFQLDEGRDPQAYGLGIKELWEIDPAKHQPGRVTHTAGWPLNSQTYGGAFLYHLPNNQVTLGFITGLDYSNPWLSPFEEMQRWKTHPAIRNVLEGGKRVG